MTNKKIYNIKSLFSVVFLFIAISGSAQDTKMELFRLSQIRLLPSPFLNAQNTDLDYMMKLDPDRLLAPFLRECGLTPKAATYENWENTGLDGHTAGHYLTALAQMYAATDNKETKRRLDYMVSELQRCQNASNNGYVGGVPGGVKMWAEVAQGDFSGFRKKWVPWYNLHKLFAGLRDCYLLANNLQAKAVLLKLSDWADNETANLTYTQMQNMLDTEHGGMNEVLADVAAITGDKKYIALAKRFSHQAILEPLEHRMDKLTGLHANTQIPKIIGFERIAELDHDTVYATAASFFWKTVVDNRSISIGGNSVREHFNPSDNFLPMLESEEGPETCNSNNMLKLTKMLFLQNPLSEYVNFYERLVYNHILSSQRPGSGGFVYFTPIHPNHYRVYSQADKSFWCCVGTGMENHGKYGELIYTHSQNNIFINLFIPSVLNWEEKGIVITQRNTFPDNEASQFKIDLKEPTNFTMYIRKPIWVKDNMFGVEVNGKILTGAESVPGYVAINRTWKNGDVVKVLLPMKNYTEYLPDHSEWISFLHGPIVLAAPMGNADLAGLNAGDSRWGHIAKGKLYDFSKAPLVVDNGTDLAKNLQPLNNDSLIFQIPSLIYQDTFKKLNLVPFYKIHDTRYVIYFPVAKQNNIKYRQQQLEAEDIKVTRPATNIVDEVAPGEQQPEVDHGLSFNDSKTGLYDDKHWRDAAGYFSYKLKGNPMIKKLQLSYFGKGFTGEFDVYAGQQIIAHIKLNSDERDKLIVKEISLPADIQKNYKNIEIKFVAVANQRTAAIYNIRLLQ